MSILIAYLESSQKSNPMSMISLTCGEILFLAVSIFRHTIFGSGRIILIFMH
jgi:hypothetical protein